MVNTQQYYGNARSGLIAMLLQGWPAWARRLMFQLLGVNWALKQLKEMSANAQNSHELLDNIFKRNRYDLTIQGEELIPREGGCVIAVNHPHGFWDGLGALWLGSRQGQDCRAIARNFLSVFEPIKALFLFVEVTENRKSPGGAAVVKEAANFLAHGGRIGICPAGRLSKLTSLTTSEDLAWKSGTVRMAELANVPIVLVHLEMNMSVIRHLLQRISPILRGLVQVWAYRFGRSQKMHFTVLKVVYPQDLPNQTLALQTKWLQNEFNRLAPADTST